MNKKTIAVIGAIALFSSIANATTMTFSGIVTDVIIHDVPNGGTTYSNVVETVVGDSFSVRVDFMFNPFHATVIVSVGGLTAFADSDSAYEFDLDLQPPSLFFNTSNFGWGGTDAGVGFYGTGFLFWAEDLLGTNGDVPYANAIGIVTKQNVPDAGDTAGFLAFAFLLTTIFSYRTMRL